MGLEFRRGSDLQRQGVIFASGEPVWTTDTNVLYVGDGVTAGGKAVTPTALNTTTLVVGYAVTASYALTFNTTTLVLQATTATYALTATSAAYAYAFNTGTLVTTATYALSFNTSTLVAHSVLANTATIAGSLVGGVVSSIIAGTGTFISTSSGAVTVWISTASTFSGGNVVNSTQFTDPTQSINTTTGAVTISGGLGVGGNINAGSYITVQDGFYSISTFTGSYSDGIVVDYVNGAVGNGRISVGPQDSITFYNGGPATTATMQISSTGTVSIPSSNTSINTGTGALVVAGGAGIGGNLNVGGQITGTNLIITNTASSTSSFTGQAIQVAGGVGVAGTVYAQNIVVANNGTLTLFRNSGQYFIFEDDDNTTLGYFRSYTSPNNAKTLNFDVRTDVQGSTATSGALGYNFSINGQNALNITWNNATNSIIGTYINGVSSTSSNSGALVVNGGLGVLGNIYQSGIHVIQNSYQAVSTTSGALQVVNGGAGIGGNVYIGGNLNVSGTISASLSGTVTTATNLSGGTAGQIPYQSSTGTTSFFGPGTVGQVLVSGGTGTPVYQNTLTLTGTTNATSTTTGALTVAGGVGVGGNIWLGNGSSSTAATVLTPNGELTLGQTGDTYGPTYLRMQNRNNQNGPLFDASSSTVALVDFSFKTSVAQRNIRFETRGGSFKTIPSGNGVEFQIGSPGSATFVVGDNAVLVNNLASASSTNTGALQVLGGAGIAGGAYIGGAVTATSMTILGSTQSNSTTTGVLTLAGGIGVGGNVNVNGAVNAITKSFLITHPTKPDMKLRYGSLEGPENGVYVRGRLKGTTTIQLPDYWTKLVDPDSITVQVTPIGKHQKLFVHEITNNQVIIENDALFGGSIDCYYVVFAERADTDKLAVEIPG